MVICSVCLYQSLALVNEMSFTRNKSIAVVPNLVSIVILFQFGLISTHVSFVQSFDSVEICRCVKLHVFATERNHWITTWSRCYSFIIEVIFYRSCARYMLWNHLGEFYLCDEIKVWNVVWLLAFCTLEKSAAQLHPLSGVSVTAGNPHNWKMEPVVVVSWCYSYPNDMRFKC